MNTRILIIPAVAALALCAPSASFAGKKNKAAPAVPTANPVMTKYDKNANGILEDTEKEAIRAALGKDPDLAVLDKNKDGKLDDAELSEITKTPATAEPSRKEKKHKKNKQAPATEAPKTVTPKPDAPKTDEPKKPQ